VRVILVSELPPPQVAAMGMQAAPSLAAALELAGAMLGPGARALLLDRGGALLPPATDEMPVAQT
jgi:hypothetical protein